MEADTKRRLVSADQLQTLLDFMREHPELAHGLSRGRRGKLMTVKVWNSCAKKLNSMKAGAVKDGKGWSKYWCDWKYRVRRHALELKVARDSNREPPEGVNELSSLEQNIMSIIGGASIDGVVVKTDPLVDELSNEEEADSIDNEMKRQTSEKNMRSDRRRRRVSPVSLQQSDDDDDDRGSPPPQRARYADAEESDSVEEESTSRQFLYLEKKQLENSKKIQASISQMSSDIRKLTDVMGEIRDVLVKRFNDVT